MIKCKNKIAVLTFGHIPKVVGGKQSSGLAVSIWKIADTINKTTKSNCQVYIVATDVNKEKTLISSTFVYGWTKKLILFSAFSNFISFLQFLLYSIRLKVKFGFPFFKTVFQLVFFNNTINGHKNQPIILHAHGVNNFMLVNFLGQKHHLKTVLTLHGITGQETNYENWESQYKIEKYVSEQTNIDSVVFITTETRNIWEGMYGQISSNSQIILNGLDNEMFYFDRTNINDFSNEKIRLLTVGRICELKGQARVVEALSLLPVDLRKKFTYYIVGIGAKKDIDSLLSMSDLYKIDVVYNGYLPPLEINRKLHNVDYLIQPSSSEGFGLMFIESIACGTPVIIPKNLPLALEKGVLNNKNAIFIQDHSAYSIKECLVDLKPWSIPREKVCKISTNLTWEGVALKYIKLFEIVNERI
jgi:glycosyltransferase involved in cell wall biosynthesis